MMIPEDRKDELISSGIGFIRSITAAYGAEKGMELWNHIATTIDQDLKGQIFFAILTGEREGTIRMRGVSPFKDNFKKINAIKEVRAFTGLGLTEAKHVIDQTELGHTVTINGPETKRRGTVKALQDAGIII